MKMGKEKARQNPQLPDYLDYDYAISMNELCRLLGVTATAIRNYDKYDAINSRRSENGYRYYYFNDIQQCLRLKSFTELGLSIREAAEVTRRTDYAQVHETVSNLLKRKDEELRTLELQRDFLTDLLTDVERLEPLHGRVCEAVRPALYWFSCQENGHIRQDPDFRSTIRKWSACVPFVQPCLLMKKEGLGPSSACDLGYCVRAKYANLLPDEALREAKAFPEKPCLVTAVYANDDIEDYYSVIETITEYLKKTEAHMKDDLIAVPVASDMLAPWNKQKRYSYYLCYFSAETP